MLINQTHLRSDQDAGHQFLIYKHSNHEEWVIFKYIRPIKVITELSTKSLSDPEMKLIFNTVKFDGSELTLA